MTETFESEVDDMCNLSQGVAEEAMQKGLEQGRQEGIEQGIEQGKSCRKGKDVRGRVQECDEERLRTGMIEADIKKSRDKYRY